MFWFYFSKMIDLGINSVEAIILLFSNPFPAAGSLHVMVKGWTLKL